MGFIKSGFTGGFLGIVISITDIFLNSIWLERLSSVGLYVANFFGKACINSAVNECTLAEKFTTIIATLVGNCIAYFVIFALISISISVIAMLFSPKPVAQPVVVQQAPIQQPPVQPVQQPVVIQVQEVKQKEPRPKKKAKVRKSKK